MKRIFSLLAFISLAAPVSAAWTYDGNDGNNIWATDGTWRIKFVKNGNTYYIGGWEGGGATLDLSTVVEDLAAGATPVTVSFSSIGNECFKNNTVVETLILPERCTTIGNNSFNGCKALATATMPGVTTVNQGSFSGCSSLATFDCPNLKSISGYAAFQGCTSLVELKVAADMTSFSSDTFRGCTSFTTLYTNNATKVVGHVQLPPGVKSLSSYNFYQTKVTHVFAPSVSSISGNGNTFAGNTLLKEVYLPSLKSISAGAAFSGCTDLQTVEISSELSGTLAANTFSGCTVLESVYQSGNNPVEGLVDLPAGVTKLEWACFMNCKAIEHVVAPGVADVQNRAFTSCTALQTVRLSPNLSVLHNNNSFNHAAFYGCSALVDFYPSTIPNITQLRAGMFQGCTSLTNTFDFSGATLSDVNGSSFFNGARNVSCVKLPASFPQLYQSEFYDMKPGAEIHFAGNIPLRADTSKKDQLYQGSGNAGYRYKIFVDAETYPAWTNNTVSGASFTAKTAAMESESDYPGVATLGFLNYASNGQNNWLVQEPFYVDVTFYDEDGTTALGVERTLLDSAPVWTGATPTKESSSQYSYTFAGWSVDGTTIIDLTTQKVKSPMSLRAVYTPVMRAYSVTWQWFDGTATQTDTQTLNYGKTPSHAPVERAATAEYSYTFQGWSTDGVTVLSSIPSVTESVTYIAVFEQKDASHTVTVRWLNDDRTTVIGTTWPDKGTAAVAPVTPSKESTVSTDYAFAGWSIDGTTVLSDLTVNVDVDFIAVYTPSVRQYTVTFINWDRSVVDVRDYNYGTAAASVVIPSDPSRPATAEYTYTFSGWNPAAVTDVLGDATYAAQYVEAPNVYAATFVDGVDGSTVLGPANYAYGAVVEAPEPPEHYGYTFAAWSPQVVTMPAADMIYTAIYTTNRYTVTWVNGNEMTTAKYDYLTPATELAVPQGTKSTSSKTAYTFLRWEPELEPVQSNTTYTAMFARTINVPMKLTLKSMDYDDGDAGEIAIAASIVNGEIGAETEVGITSVLPAVCAASAENSENIVATLSNLKYGNGYEWTITATQTIYGVSEVAKLYGRSWARREKDWFVSENVSWSEDAYAPNSGSPLGQQIRLDAAVTFPAILPRTLPEDAATRGAVVGIAAYQPNAGIAEAYYCWNGSAWVKLVGASPVGGAEVRIFGVVDFARKGGAAVAWYADGIQLTTESGEWEVPLAGGAGLKSFKRVGNLTVDELSADFSVGGLGLFIILR
jgi:hypothetical protein